jgi:hypothetical protein|tara:strand:+ start:6094 stop:7890 length:1797 start_codon:yes stop_codon:yes gene_type:complete
MPKDEKKLLPIDYTHREFETIQEDLLEIAERFYPDSFQDFSEASFGALMIDAVAYVGDQLSFYLDYNVNESFLDTAYQYTNVVRHGAVLGYKSQGRPSTYGSVAIFMLVPASSTGIGPDTNYMPVLKRGTTFGSGVGLSYVLTENIDFASSANTFVAARVDATTGAPTHYAIKTYGNVVSGQFGQERVAVGPFERFRAVSLDAQNVSEIISVFDTEGNEYFEVDYLVQDTVFKEVTNSNFKNDNVPSIIKPTLVSRKFMTQFSRSDVTLQFGSGKMNNSDIVANPQSVAVDVFGKSYTTTVTFDPSRLSENESFGIVPTNTTLIITYRTTNGTNSNVAVGSLNTVNSAVLEFINRQDLSGAKVAAVRASIEVSNEEPIVGDVTYPSTAEIKQRVYDTFPTQNRAVTQADYENVAYRMHPKFGSIKRVSVQKDPDSQKRNLNMYVVSEDTAGKLTLSNSTIKNNLKTWINQYRMINDTVDILDPFILNFGLEFIARPQNMADKYIVLDRCMDALKKHFEQPFFIGEPLYISDIYKVLKDVVGILDVTKVKIFIKSGTGYSNAAIHVNENLSGDGSYLVVPNNAILELKFPEVDMIGTIR